MIGKQRKTKAVSASYQLKPADQRKHTVEIDLFEVKEQTTNFNLITFVFIGHSELVIVSRLSVVSIHSQIQVLSRQEQEHIYFILVISIHQNPTNSLFLTHPAKTFLCFPCHTSNHQYNVFDPIFSDQVKADTADNLSIATS